VTGSATTLRPMSGPMSARGSVRRVDSAPQVESLSHFAGLTCPGTSCRLRLPTGPRRPVVGRAPAQRCPKRPASSAGLARPTGGIRWAISTGGS
jgi:hypothetical protein